VITRSQDKAMRKRLLVLPVLLFALGLAQAQTVYTELSSQPQGLLQFFSVTPKNRYELVHRSYDRQPTVVQGTLQLPVAGDGPFPAMVIAHGSGGIEAKDRQRWVPLLRSMGIATFLLDSFSTRHISRTVDDQSQLDQAANDADALAALRLLASDPRLDPHRIGIMGFSRGGIVALETANDYFRRGMLGDDVKFAAHIAFYPGCGLRYWRLPSPMTGAPIMLALGGADNYTPAPSCLAYADTLRAAGQQVEVKLYPNAQHDFDALQTVLVSHPQAQTSRNCPDREIDPLTWHYKVLTTGAVFQDVKAFTAAVGPCLTTGVTTGGDAAAARQAEADVRAFLTRVLHPSAPASQ
jgi:dienelactone hydrolase